MCFSTNAIEQLAYDMSEKIHENSIYKVVKIDFIGGKSIELPNKNKKLFSMDTVEEGELPLITKLFLDGENGTLYAIEPNINGLRFAKGEISYKEYNKIQKGEKYKGFMYVSISIISFLLIGWTMVEFLT